MVFTNYRDTASALLKSLEEERTIKAIRFVGQASHQGDQGLTQKKQAVILDKFRKGEYNVLIATSVGEEGIDIPATDMVLFYEPVPSEKLPAMPDYKARIKNYVADPNAK